MAKSVVFSDPMERKVIALAVNEGVISVPCNGEYLLDRLKREAIERGEKSQILANIFLNPCLRLQGIYEVQFESNRQSLNVEMQKEYNYDKKFNDFPLLCSLAQARYPFLTLPELRDRLVEYVVAEKEIIKEFGFIPTKQDNGELYTTDQVLQMAVTQIKSPEATETQKVLFDDFQKKDDKVREIKSIYRELLNLKRRVNLGDSVVIDPLLKNSFIDFASEEEVATELLDMVDVFYLFIKELKTLPVGRTINETLELAISREGDSLRKRVSEYHDLILSGEFADLEKIRNQIKDDVHQYKQLTARLSSQNTLSDATDLTLAATSLIPGIGTVIGGIGLAKTVANTAQRRSLYKKIQESIWAEYKGSAI